MLLNLSKILIMKIFYMAFNIVLHKNYIVCCIAGKHDEFGNILSLVKTSINIYPIYTYNKPYRYMFIDIYKLAKAKIIIIDSANYYISHLPISNKTKIIYCGHGGGVYKKMGFCGSNIYSNKNKEDKRKKRIYGHINYVVSSSKKLDNYLAKNFNIAPRNILHFGLPRTDKLYQINIKETKEYYYNFYNIDKHKKIILYAPTFRNIRGRKCKIFLDAQKIPSSFLKKYKILLRVHPSVKNHIPIHMQQNFLDVSHIPLYDALAIADILVTDYSSVLFDYAFFQRPIYLLVPDLEEYQLMERELWITPHELAGEGVCSTTEELIEKITTKRIHHNIWDNFMDACDGNASYRLANFCLFI